MIFDVLILLCWFVFAMYWLVSAFSAKKNLPSKAASRNVVFRLVIVVLVLAMLSYLRQNFSLNVGKFTLNPAVEGLGVILCILGIALAIWARVNLGRNWGMPMTLKENRELVTTGPYHYIRHPIYSGILLAILGSSLVAGLVWLVMFVVFFFYFMYSAKMEERMITKELPGVYSEYKKRTKMLIPFIL